jgi:hypothetical protein
MTFRPRTILFALACAATPLAAQIGSEPSKSPYKDLEDGQRFGLVAGLWAFGKDPVGVGPSGTAAALGVRYDLAINGPAYLTLRALSGNVTRNVINFDKKPALRLVGTQSSVLTDIDAGLSVALTGARTFHNIQPLVNFGVGMMFTAGDNKGDVSGFALKPALSLTTGAGVRWVTSANSELRADVSLNWWQLKYPESYRSTDADPQAVYPTGGLSPWTTNKTVTVAWTWRIFR